MAVIVQLRRGDASEWTAANPTLAPGEMGVEIDTGRFKVGDGATEWTALDYSSGDDGSVWYHDSREPSVSDGQDGDVFLRTDTADIYYRSEGSWTQIMNIQGPQGDTTGAFDGGYPNSVYTSQTMDGGVVA